MLCLGVDSTSLPVPGVRMKTRTDIRVRDGTRKYLRVSGLSPGSNLTVFNNTLNNLVLGVQKRMMLSSQGGKWLPPVRSEPGLIARDLRPFRNSVLQKMSPSLRHTPLQVALSYKGGRQQVLVKAAESLDVEEFAMKDATVKAFIKYEKGKPDGVPRIICPRSDRYLVHCASWLKPVEPKICHAVDRVWGSTTIAKGLNAAQVGSLFKTKWESKLDPVCVSIDAHRFDQHVGPEALEAEHSLYNGHFKSRKLKSCLKMQLENDCLGVAADGSVKFRVSGGRMSGDINTSVGNCYLMCGLVRSYCLESKVSTADLVNNGDDCAIIMERCELEAFLRGLDKWFRRRGFIMIAEDPVYELEKIEFCQGHPIVIDEQTCLMVRNVAVAMQKDTMCLMPISKPDDFVHWVRAIGDAGGAMAGDVPILGAYYRYMATAVPVGRCKSADVLKATGLFYHSRGMNRRGLSVTQQARYSFYVAFGILPDEQIALEKEISEFDSIPTVTRIQSDIHVPLHESLSNLISIL